MDSKKLRPHNNGGLNNNEETHKNTVPKMRNHSLLCTPTNNKEFMRQMLQHQNWRAGVCNSNIVEGSLRIAANNPTLAKQNRNATDS
jgi:hypothetical protein